MNLFEQISEDIKKAMLAKDKVALDALRGIKKEFLEAKTAKGGDGELHDDRALQILQKMVKQRKEAVDENGEQDFEVTTPPYCEYCGAKMDGKENEDA
mgnify:CR=1 FL=1